MDWILKVLVAVDQLGNAIAGGNPDATISARVGYFSQTDDCSYKWYWKTLERFIDFTFYPVDGPHHCRQAYLADKDEKFERGSDLARALLGIIVIVPCTFISIPLFLTVLITPSLRDKSNKEDTNQT